MRREPPLVAIAGVSLHERRVVESILERTGFATVAVDDGSRRDSGGLDV